MTPRVPIVVLWSAALLAAASEVAAEPDSTAVAAPDSSAAVVLSEVFDSRYDRYLEAEERYVHLVGADRVRLVEATELALAAETLAAEDELEAAVALVDEAIALLDGAAAAPPPPARSPRRSPPRQGRGLGHRRPRSHSPHRGLGGGR